MGLDVRTTAPAHATGAVEFVALDEIADDARFRLRSEGDVAALATSIGRLGQLTPIELRPWPDAASGPGPRWQVVAGFRRLAALRLLQRERVLARLHEQLEDQDAWSLALGQALLTEPLGQAEVEALRARLDGSPAAHWADELLDEALVRAPVAPELREQLYELLRGAAAGAAGPLRSETETTGHVRGAGDDGARDTAEGARDASGLPGGRVEAQGAGDPVAVTPEELAEDLAVRLNGICQDLALAWECWSELPPQSRARIVEQARYIAELLPFLEGAQ